MEPESAELSFLRSSLIRESPSFDNSDLLDWFSARKAANSFSVRRIPFDEMDQWHFEASTRNLVHASGRFFRIEGLRVRTNFEGVRSWDQPIINQPEIGILGILSKRFDGVRHFLMQVKAEPGNINTLQLSPTVQATRSNYSQVHRGRVPSYLEYFLHANAEQRLVDQLQTEQSSRFLKKRNRNMIIDVESDVPVLDDFRWLTLGEIKDLLQSDNLVNMDARSVLSCVPYAVQGADGIPPEEARLTQGFGRTLLESIHAGENAMHSMHSLDAWLGRMRTRYELEIERIPLSAVEHWETTGTEIVHDSREHFSVIAVAVEAGNREVAHWTQPLLKDASPGLHGFITQKHAGMLHFLVQAKVEPGNLDVVDLAPTVSCANVEIRRRRSDLPPFLTYFLEAQEHQIRFSSIQSEEGGRFFQLENRNTILELAEGVALDIPEHFVWMSLSQLMEMSRLGNLSIDARTLLASLKWT
jgi:oxidase EvaA